MKTLSWIIKLVLFLIALTFAVKNTDIITLRYYLGLQWQAPLILVILVVFGLGAIAGVFAGLAHIVRLRRELIKLRRQVTEVPATAEFATTTRVNGTL
jgi:lipopolysaccharide assembly protein A